MISDSPPALRCDPIMTDLIARNQVTFDHLQKAAILLPSFSMLLEMLKSYSK